MLAKQDEKLTNRVVLLMEGRGIDLDKSSILKMLKSALPKYHNPKEIIMVEKIYFTLSGKIDRIKNASAYL